MEDTKIFVSAGDLLRDLPRTPDELSKLKEKGLLQIVETIFFGITGLHCAPRKFRKYVQKYVNKIKNNRRKMNDDPHTNLLSRSCFHHLLQ